MLIFISKILGTIIISGEIFKNFISKIVKPNSNEEASIVLIISFIIMYSLVLYTSFLTSTLGFIFATFFVIIYSFCSVYWINSLKYLGGF